MKIAKIGFFIGLSLLIAVSLAQALEIGPAPTSASLNVDGTFAVSSASVSKSSVKGFGGGTIYYPSASGSYGVIAVCPGFTESSSVISWFAKRLATFGFVTIAMNTNSVFDQPSSRATQLKAALDYMVNSSSSTIRARIDKNRRAVAGHSMGGGGTLIVSGQDLTLKAGIALEPYNSSKDFSNVSVPQLIIGADGDSIAPINTYATPMYNSLPGTTKKAYAVLNGATHFTSNKTDERVGRYGVAWAKFFVDGDARYSPFLCGAEATAYQTSARFDSYQSNCPY
jgi:predicted dienelactone hydrolase